MLRDSFAAVTEIAADNHGYFTVDQARRAGVKPMAVIMMAKRQSVERIAHGVYRVPALPVEELGPYMAATLWPVGKRAVLSHETALELLQISNANPDKIHLTVPTDYRIRRAIPKAYAIHHGEIQEHEITMVEGVPVTSAKRTILDCYEAHVSPAIIREALEDARDKGRLTADEARWLKRKVLTDD